MKNNSPSKSSINLSILVFLLFLVSCNNNMDKKTNKNTMFMNNKLHSGVYNSPSVKSKPNILWTIKTDGQVISSPVIVEDIVYIGSEDGKLYAIKASSGDIKWVYKTEGPVNSTPVVSKGKVMFLSFDGFFYALNQSDGKLVWKFETGGETKFMVKDYYNGSFKPDFWDFYLSSAIVSDKIVYFGSSDSNVYALDIKSGEKVWSYKTGGNIHSSPAIYCLKSKSLGQNS